MDTFVTHHEWINSFHYSNNWKHSPTLKGLLVGGYLKRQEFMVKWTLTSSYQRSNEWRIKGIEVDNTLNFLIFVLGPSYFGIQFLCFLDTIFIKEETIYLLLLDIHLSSFSFTSKAASLKILRNWIPWNKRLQRSICNLIRRVANGMVPGQNHTGHKSVSK